MTTGIDLETQIGKWRGYVQRHRTISSADIDEMEDHLREQIADLSAAGLDGDEAFLVAVKRMGNVDALSREFAREHSDRLWKQLVLMPTATAEGSGDKDRPWRELLVVLGLGVGAGLAVKVGIANLDESVAARNISLFVLPFLTGYFAWKRKLAMKMALLLLIPFVLAAVVLNVYPFATGEADTAILAAIHAPIALWLVTGLAYAGWNWRSDARRMDFIRFTGEYAIYLTLLALGGQVLLGLTIVTFELIGVDTFGFIFNWVLPFAVPGAVMVAAWLVEAKQNVVENIAPVLTRVFTPLTIVMLVALLAVFPVVAGNILEVDRNLLIVVDLILVLVLGLLLYAISARDPGAPPGIFDHLQLVLVISALAVDLVMLTAMLTRIAEFGSSPNKVAALGMNLVLLVNLTWSAWLTVGFLRRRHGPGLLERWQTQYLPAYGAWAVVVVAVLPPVFGFA